MRLHDTMPRRGPLRISYKGTSSWHYYEVTDSQGTIIDRLDADELHQAIKEYRERGYEV